MTTAIRSAVIVGVDGSPGSDAALDWAVAEAADRHLGIHVVHGLGSELTYASMTAYGRIPVPDIAAVEAHAQRMLDAAVLRVRAAEPDLPVTRELDNRDPVLALVGASEHAPLVVVGSRQRGPIGSAVLGSVSGAVAARANCPVVVVRGPAGLAAEHAGIVVGIDLFEESEGELRFAFEHAAQGDLPLDVVCCWSPDLLAGMMWRPQQPAPGWVVDRLAEKIAGFQAEFPGVKVHSSVVRDHPVDGLVAAATAQSLLVVGSRTRRPVVGALLGSVSQGVLHHASCPVAVVPYRD